MSRSSRKMRYVAAYLLAVLGGNAHPTAANIESILGSVGVDADSAKVKLVVEKLKGKSIAVSFFEFIIHSTQGCHSFGGFLLRSVSVCCAIRMCDSSQT